MSLHYRDLPGDRFSFFYSQGRYNYQAVKRNTPLAVGAVSRSLELDEIAGVLCHRHGITEVFLSNPDGSYKRLPNTPAASIQSINRLVA